MHLAARHPPPTAVLRSCFAILGSREPLQEQEVQPSRRFIGCVVRPSQNQISLDMRESLPIIHLVRNPVRKQMNMMENTRLWELSSIAIIPDEKTR